MRLVGLDEIKAGLNLEKAIVAVRDGLIAYSDGRVSLGEVAYLGFDDVVGECHIKSAAMKGGELFAVKVSTGFPQNSRKGLRTSDGLIVLLDSRTGEPTCGLLDRGYLTDLRTAIAGGLAASLIRPERCDVIGLLGTGIQACLQAEIASYLTGVTDFIIWGRNQANVDRAILTLRNKGLHAEQRDELQHLAQEADLLITCTSSKEPLLSAAMVGSGARIVAIGADAPGKQELSTCLVEGLDIHVVDSAEQCLDCGELSHAYRQGKLRRGSILELGALLKTPPQWSSTTSVIVDLTGLGIQDLQLATAVWESLEIMVSQTDERPAPSLEPALE